MPLTYTSYKASVIKKNVTNLECLHCSYSSRPTPHMESQSLKPSPHISPRFPIPYPSPCKASIPHSLLLLSLFPHTFTYPSHPPPILSPHHIITCYISYPYYYYPHHHVLSMYISCRCIASHPSLPSSSLHTLHI